MFIKGLSLLLLAAGIFVLMQVVSPYVAFKGWELLAYDKNTVLVDPHPSNGSGFTGKTISVENIGDFPAFVVRNGVLSEPLYKEFKISAPSINLFDQRVAVNSNNFDEIPAHLPGSGLPGERGNVFITAHSSLPTGLTNNKRAYFVNLPSFKKGDSISVDVLGQRFNYQVVGLRIVDPNDISVIDPPDKDGRYLSLMTCVPPGFNTRRLVVLGRLIN